METWRKRENKQRLEDDGLGWELTTPTPSSVPLHPAPCENNQLRRRTGPLVDAGVLLRQGSQGQIGFLHFMRRSCMGRNGTSTKWFSLLVEFT